jgi:hypothetical protein
MLRRKLIVVLIAVVTAAPVAAASADERAQNAPKVSSGSGKRVLWTIIGAAAGFGAGVYFGLNQFDDAVNSDRKVWISALAGAAAGGVTGNLLSRNVGPGRGLTPPDQNLPGGVRSQPKTSWTAAVTGTQLLTPPARR